MGKLLPFFNWSLKKAQNTEPDSFIRSQISIVFTILVFSLFKGIVVLGVSYEFGLWMQLQRAAIVLLLYIVMTKILLYKPSSLKLLAHIMIFSGMVVVVTNIFLYSHKINLATVQFVFMIVLCGFYTLGSLWGIIYAVMSILPVMVFLFFKGNGNIYFNNTPQ